MKAHEGLAADCIKHRSSLVEVRLHVDVSNGGFAFERMKVKDKGERACV